MADSGSFARSGRGRIVIAVVALIALSAGFWFWITRGREHTDDAQVDAHVTQVASRVGGSVLRVAVVDNQSVEAGATLVELDPRDYQVAVDKARAELADAEAAAIAAQSNVPITSTTTESGVSGAQGVVDRARTAMDTSAKEIEAARARVSAAQSRLREAEANAVKSRLDVERLKGLLAKDEISQQQYDTALSAADASAAATDTARALIAEAEASLEVAKSRQVEAAASERQARAALRSAQTGPEQVTAMRAQASAAQARVAQAKATLEQAELNLQYTAIKAPARGVVSKKSVNPGQVIQPGQPLMALVQSEDVWITANFKETQLSEMRPGQRVSVDVDAYPGKSFQGKVDSIAAATGARFSLFPPENATGNFVKVVQRVPVKIVLDAGQDPEHLLRPGMSVTPTVYFR